MQETWYTALDDDVVSPIVLVVMVALAFALKEADGDYT